MPLGPRTFSLWYTALTGLLIVAASQTCLVGQELAIDKADLDLAGCRVLVDGKPRPATIDELFEPLGLEPGTGHRRWVGAEPVNRPTKFQYVVALKRPVAVGSVFVCGSPQKICYLKPGAKPTADAQDAAWVPLEFLPNQSGARLAICPSGFQTQALLLSDDSADGGSAIELLRLFKARLQNITPGAMAYASHEYYRPPSDFVTPFLYAASLVTSNTGSWFSAGKGTDGRVAVAPITDLQPEWFMVAWDEKQTLNGLWLRSNISGLSLEYFVGADTINPRVGIRKEWRKVRESKQWSSRGRWISFDKPLTTRGLRLNITKADSPGSKIAEIDGLHVFTALGDRPAIELATTGPVEEPAPVKIPIKLADEGNLTMVVNGAEGQRVRNVTARGPAPAGANSIAWDLRDESGNYAPPGEYTWSALTCPTLQMKYEFTVYPNVNENSPQNPAWFVGTHGPGGWLADHAQNTSVCAVGKRVFLGASTSESGVSLIECDLTGAKQWAFPSFAAWTGCAHLASDGQEIFNGNQVAGQIADTIWGINFETRQVRTVVSLPPSSQRKRGLKGLAARDGKIYLSIHSPENFLADAASEDDVDLAACFPLYGPPRQPKKSMEVVPDPRNDFLRLFRLKDSPSGTATQGSLAYLQSMKDPSQRQFILLTFRRSVPIGSLVFPRPVDKEMHVQLSVLKPDAALPPKMNDERQWIELDQSTDNAWDVVAAPEGTVTRALRIAIRKGALPDKDDLLAATAAETTTPDDGLTSGESTTESQSLTDFKTDHERWQAQLEGMKILRRRFENVSGQATVRVNSGKVDVDGQWDAQRTRALTPEDPGIYVQQWDRPQALRGLALKEIDGRKTAIDVYTGPDTGEIDIESSKSWRQVAEYEQPRRYWYEPNPLRNIDARYLDGSIDFGREIKTRAVRLRVLEQWSDLGPQNTLGVRVDRGGQTLDPTRCQVYGVAALSYLGGEHPVDNNLDQRLEVFDSASGKLVDEVAIDRPGRLAFDHRGQLHGISGNQVVTIDLDGDKHRPIITDLEQPIDMAFDRQGQIYVADREAKRQNVRVYDAAGKYLRSIGKPGGNRIAGAWDSERCGPIVDIDVDDQDQLWIVDESYWPKRITLWKTDGTFVREFLGNTPYGGGGALNAFDRRRLFIGPLEFELDWKTGHSRLKNLTWTGITEPGDLAIKIDKRQYVVTRPQMGQRCGVVYRYLKDHFKLAAAVGQAAAFEPLQKPEMIAALGGKALTGFKFMWSDLNDNGEVDTEEVKLSPKPDNMPWLTSFNRDLGAQAGPLRYRVKEYLPSGVPVYEEEQFPKVTIGNAYRLDNGNFYGIGADGKPESVVTPEGRVLWTYPSEGAGGHAFFSAKPWWPGQVVAEFGYVGHETASTGDLGEFVCMHAGGGAWNVFTADGLLVGPLFRDMRDPLAKPWSMLEHKRGMVLQDVSLAQEHFQGYMCQSLADGKFYVVAGHNHASVLEVLGLEKVRRYQGKIKITADDVKRVQAWEERHQKSKVYQRAPVVDCYRLKKPPQLDGRLDEWESASATLGKNMRFYIGFDDTNLYVAYAAANVGPLKNTGQQWDRLFKTGASVDLQLGVDPEAATDRGAPVAGDLRLLMTFVNNRPAAVLYRPVVEGTSASAPWRVVSPVGDVTFDEVRQAPEVHVVRGEDGLLAVGGYTVEAAIPLATLGLKPADGLRLKLDWGLLRSGPDGHEVLERIYWSNKATGIVADAPSEARLHPDLWGFVRFVDSKQPSTEDRFEADEVTGTKRDKKLSGDVDDILDSIEDQKK